MTIKILSVVLLATLLTACNLANPKPAATPTPMPSALPTALPTFNTQPLNTPVYRPTTTYQPAPVTSPLPSLSPSPTPLVGTNRIPTTGSGLKDVVELTDSQSSTPQAEVRFSQNTSNQTEIDAKVYKGAELTGQAVEIYQGSCAEPTKLVAILNPLQNGHSYTTLSASAQDLTTYPSLVVSIALDHGPVLCGAMNE